MQGDEITIKELLHKFRAVATHLKTKGKQLLVLATLGGLLGLAYAFFTKPLYKAKLSFALEDDKGAGGLGGALGLASQFGFDLGGSTGGAFTGDNLIELMKSRSMVEKALLSTVRINNGETTLADYYIKFNYKNKWADKGDLNAISYSTNSSRNNFSRLQDSVLGIIQKDVVNKNLTVMKVDKKLSILTVSVSSVDEIFSKAFSEALVKEVSNFYIETKTKKTSQNLEILQHQTDSVRRVLNQAISGVASAVDNNPNPNPAMQILRAPSQRRQIDVQANTAILTELVKNLEISKVTLRKETPLIQIIDTPILPLEKDQVSKVMSFIVGFLLTILIASSIYIAKLALRKY